jgi:exodeoxyribonuclease VII large subunit
MTFVQPDMFAAPEPHVFQVREINEAVRQVLEEGFGEIFVEGEISNAKQQAASGHWYFSLKDEAAEIGAVMFRGDAAQLRFRPENGLAVRVRGKLNVYVPRGRYQVQVRSMEPVGQGALELAFKQLKEKLALEGLFDAERKRSLPRFPHRIALVTSPSGAAVRDVLTTLAGRWPLALVLVVPVQVQGDAAPREIVQALDLVSRSGVADVLLLVRGGGSLEDLWAFNDERVARAIAACRIPVVTGIGHEVDFTIADFVADRRAATPTAAAAAAVPHRDEMQRWLAQTEHRAARALRRRLELPKQRLESLLGSYAFRRMRGLVPEHLQTVDGRLDRLERGLRLQLERRAERMRALTAQLDALGPRRVLERGYTYCVDAATGIVVSRATATHAGQELRVQFADGTQQARILAPYAGSEAKGEQT